VLNILDVIKGQLVVSCQALPDEPLHSSFIMGRMARAAKEGGAVAIRAQGVADICEIREAAALPVIGIIKKKYSDSEIYITATKNEVEALLESHCDMIALDGTLRRRPNGESFGDLVRLIKAYHRLVMADISDVEEALAAQEAGVDCVSTTLSGYTSYAPKFDGPDFDLIRRLAGLLKIPLLAEGRINTPEDLKKVYEYGAYSAVVGSAITRPQLITGKFVKALQIN
jgi:N-acylglucosamine-6-phosphate 2-epimerase